MSAPNLTRVQAAERAATVAVSRYAIDLDLTDGADAPGEKTFGSTTTITFTATPGAETFIDLIAGGITATLLAGSLLLQLRARRYVPWIYWLSVVLLSVVGTQITDALTDGADISLYASTATFAVILAIVFAVWHRSEGTLSIHTIVTTRREVFYWAAILFTFALGTAAGDLATEALGLGFNLGVWVFGAAITFIAVAWRFGADPILTFWLAYILTRPLGASLGDLLSQSRANGGLGLGTIATSLIFLAVIAVLVAGLRGGGWQGEAPDLMVVEVEGGPVGAARVAAELIARAFHGAA